MRVGAGMAMWSNRKGAARLAPHPVAMLPYRRAAAIGAFTDSVPVGIVVTRPP